MLDIHLLGMPRVYLNKTQISVKRKRTRALFFFLAMHPQGVERGLLADLFGGDGDSVKKRSRLRRYLNFVRQIDKDHEFVITYHDTVRIDPEQLSVDALKLLALADDVKKNHGTGRDSGRTIPIPLFQDVEKFVSELAGSDFISSSDMDQNNDLSQWKTAEDARLKRAQGVLLTFLAELNAKIGRAALSLGWAERALDVNPTEDAYYYQLRALRDMGEFDKARAEFLSLEKSFGGDMSRRLREMGREILQMEVPSPSQVSPDWPIRPSMLAPFVGQDALIELMLSNYQQGIGTLVTGEAGAGKTRLVQEFHESLALRPQVLLVPCYRDRENLPYQPWKDMLSHAFDEAFWQDFPKLWTEPLGMLLRELHDYRDDLDSKPSDFFAHQLVVEAMMNVLVHASKEDPLLLFVDDAQWMDRASMGLLQYLIQQSVFDQWKIGLVITSRVGTKRDFDHLDLGELPGKLDEIELARLDDVSIKFLTSYLLNEKFSDDQIAHLQKLTGGNPYFLLEILNFHKTHAEVDIFASFSKSPSSVEQLIATRLNALLPSSRKVLTYAAIQGNHFGLGLLEEVLGLPMEEMTDVIAELEDVRLIHFLEEDGDLYYAFSHEKLREEIIRLLSPADLRMIHAKLAEVLAPKNLYQNELAAVLAEHYEKAGALREAFFSWVAAAKHAYRFLSANDAYTAYLRAEKLVSHLSLSDEELYDFYFGWNLTLRYNDVPDMLEEVMNGMLSLGKQRKSSLLIGTALDGLGDVCMVRDEFERGLEFVEEALAYLIMDSHIPAQMNAFIHQGVFHYLLKNFPAALDSFQTVLSLSEEYIDRRTPHPVGHAHYQMAVGMTGMGYPLIALEHAKKSLHYMRLSGVPHASMLPHSIMTMIYYYLGEYTAGKEHALHSIELSRRTNSQRMLGYSISYAGINETEIPELGNAWQRGLDSVAYGQEFDHPDVIGIGQKIFGDIYARLEAPIKAAEAYQKGLDVDRESIVSVENAARLGVILGLLGKPEADALLENAIANAHEAGLETVEISARALQLSLFVTRKEYDLFDAKRDAVGSALVERSHPKSFVWVDYLQSLRLYQEGKLEGSLALLEQTLPVLGELEFFWIHMRAQRLYVDLLKALGRDPANPRAKLAEMLNIIETGLGDAPLWEEWAAFSKKIRSM